MSWRARAASAWRNLFRRTRVERDLDAEMKGYVDMLTDEHVRAGMPAGEARRAALLATGGVEQVKEQVRDVKMGVFLQTLWQDARYAARVLVKTPGFSAAAILTLTLGIGATTAIFSVVDGVLFRPLPFPEADRLASVFMKFTPQNMARGPLSMADALDVLANCRSFQEIPGSSQGGHCSTLARAGGTAGSVPAEQVTGLFATPKFFSVLGVRPLLGRTFLPGEDAPNGVAPDPPRRRALAPPLSGRPGDRRQDHHRQQPRLHHRRRDARHVHLSERQSGILGQPLDDAADQARPVHVQDDRTSAPRRDVRTGASGSHGARTTHRTGLAARLREPGSPRRAAARPCSSATRVPRCW